MTKRGAAQAGDATGHPIPLQLEDKMDIDIERLKVDAAYWDEVAPEGATHYIIDNDCNVAERPDSAFHRDEGEKWQECGSSSFWYKDTCNPLIIIPRPTQWSGDGLPPVGCRCWMRPSLGLFEEVTITYMGDGVFCYRSDSGSEYTGSIGDCGFSPLKSDKERAVEAALKVGREQLLNEYYMEQLAEALYDAGLLTTPKA